MRLMFKYKRNRLTTELVGLLKKLLGWDYNQPKLLKIRTGNHIYYQNNVRYLKINIEDNSSPFMSEKSNKNISYDSWAGLHKNDLITGREIFCFTDVNDYSSSILIVQIKDEKPHHKFDKCSYLDVEIINEADNNYKELNDILNKTVGRCIEIN